MNEQPINNPNKIDEIDQVSTEYYDSLKITKITFHVNHLTAEKIRMGVSVMGMKVPAFMRELCEFGLDELIKTSKKIKIKQYQIQEAQRKVQEITNKPLVEFSDAPAVKKGQPIPIIKVNQARGFWKALIMEFFTSEHTPNEFRAFVNSKGLNAPSKRIHVIVCNHFQSGLLARTGPARYVLSNSEQN